jgi:hypothetical protein
MASKRPKKPVAPKRPSEPAAKRRPQYVLPGTEEGARAEAWWNFFEVLNESTFLATAPGADPDTPWRRVPQMLRDLRSHALPVFRELVSRGKMGNPFHWTSRELLSPDFEPLKARVDMWAMEYGLEDATVAGPCPWARDVAFATLQEWWRWPLQWQGEAPLEFHSFSPGPRRDLRELYRPKSTWPTERTFRFEHPGWDPFAEEWEDRRVPATRYGGDGKGNATRERCTQTIAGRKAEIRARFERELEAYADRMEELARQQGGIPQEGKKNSLREHLGWVALYVIEGCTYEEVADLCRVGNPPHPKKNEKHTGVPTVSRGVRSMGKVLGLRVGDRG